MKKPNLNKQSLKQYMGRALSQLNRGEKVKVDFSTRSHIAYLNLKMAGLFPDLLCVKEAGSFWIARVR